MHDNTCQSYPLQPPLYHACDLVVILKSINKTNVLNDFASCYRRDVSAMPHNLVNAGVARSAIVRRYIHTRKTVEFFFGMIADRKSENGIERASPRSHMLTVMITVRSKETVLLDGTSDDPAYQSRFIRGSARKLPSETRFPSRASAKPASVASSPIRQGFVSAAPPLPRMHVDSSTSHIHPDEVVARATSLRCYSCASSF